MQKISHGIRLQEARFIKTAEDALMLLQTGKLAGRLGGKKFIPDWLSEDPDTFTKLVTKTLETIGNDTNIAGDEVIQFLIKASSKGPEKWETALEESPDTIIELSKAMATQWFKSAEWAGKIDTLITAPSFEREDWHDLEKDIQDVFAKRAAKKGKKVSGSATSNLYDTLYDDGTWKLFVPKCFEGDVELASHMKSNASNDKYKAGWCTAASKNYYDQYSNKGTNKFYVIQYWENGEYTKAWQMACNKATHIEFMDRYDHPNYDFVFDNAPEELLSKIVVDHPDSLYYGVTLDKLFIALAPVVATKPKGRSSSRSSGSVNINDVYSLSDELSLDAVFLEKDGFFYTDTGYITKYPVDVAEELTIPEGIVRLKPLNDELKAKIEVVNLSSTVTEIPATFAKGSSKLRTVNVNESLEKIGEAAFEGCKLLESVNIPSSIKELGSRAFAESGLISLRIPERAKLTEIPEECCYACESLTELTLNAGLKKIGTAAFCEDTNLTLVDFPQGLETIGNSSFGSTGLTNVVIPDSVKMVQACAFDSCENLEFARLPAYPEKVGVGVFMFCEKLRTIENASVLANVKKATLGCDSLETTITESRRRY